MKKIFFCLSVIIISTSCHRLANENLIKFDIDDSFDISGSFFKENESYVYFAKRKFNPSVIIFNKEGKELDSISLSKAEEKLNEITHVWLNNRDSIFVYSYYINTMVILDKKGEILDVKNMSGIKDEKGHVYELYPPYGNIESSDNMTFTAFLLKKYDDNDYGSWESLSDYCQKMKDGYLIYKESINGVDGVTRFGLKISDFNGFLDADSILFLPFWQTSIANNNYIFNSKYSKYIYLLDDDLSIKHSVKIIPDSIKIMQPVTLDGNVGTSAEIALFSDTQSQTGHVINHIFYDENRHNYIISVLDFDVETNKNFPYKLYVFDKNFNKIKEVSFDNKEKYDGKNCIFINPYILIERTDLHDEGKRFFEIIHL